MQAAFGKGHQLTLETAVQSLETLLCDKEGIQTLKKAVDQRVRDLQLLANIQGHNSPTGSHSAPTGRPELADLKADEDVDRLFMIAEDKQTHKARCASDGRVFIVHPSATLSRSHNTAFLSQHCLAQRGGRQALGLID